jgi:hypothetical protein
MPKPSSLPAIEAKLAAQLVKDAAKPSRRVNDHTYRPSGYAQGLVIAIASLTGESDDDIFDRLAPPLPTADLPPAEPNRGWWNLTCFNGLSAEQQVRLISYGNLPLGYQPGGTCPNGANVAIESEVDAAPGPRFYCWDCALVYVQDLRDGTDQLPELEKEG